MATTVITVRSRSPVSLVFGLELRRRSCSVVNSYFSYFYVHRCVRVAAFFVLILCPATYDRCLTLLYVVFLCMCSFVECTLSLDVDVRRKFSTCHSEEFTV
jgi:hypothetical protein